MPQAPLLGAPPSSSVLRSLLRLPCSPPLRFSASASAVLPIAHASLCRGSHSLPPETPPPPQAGPSRSAGDQRASRRPRGAGSPAPTEADPGPDLLSAERTQGESRDPVGLWSRSEVRKRVREPLSPFIPRCYAAAPAGFAKPGGLLGTGPGRPWLSRAAVSLLCSSHHPAGGHVGNGGDLRQGVREHRGRLRSGHRAVPLPRARRLLLLLHGRQGPAQEPVGDAGAQPRRGAGAGFRRAAAAGRAARCQPERHAAARLRRHGVATAARRSAIRAGRSRRHLQRLPGVCGRRRACARSCDRGAALRLLGSAHAQPGGLGRWPRAAPPAAGLRHRAGQHRWRLRRGGRRVPLPPARRLFLLLHAGQAAAQDAVGEADEEPRRGAGHDLRRRRLEAPRDAEPERDVAAAARRRRLAAQPRP